MFVRSTRATGSISPLSRDPLPLLPTGSKCPARPPGGARSVDADGWDNSGPRTTQVLVKRPVLPWTREVSFGRFPQLNLAPILALAALGALVGGCGRVRSEER